MNAASCWLGTSVDDASRVFAAVRTSFASAGTHALPRYFRCSAYVPSNGLRFPSAPFSAGSGRRMASPRAAVCATSAFGAPSKTTSARVASSVGVHVSPSIALVSPAFARAASGATYGPNRSAEKS